MRLLITAALGCAMGIANAQVVTPNPLSPLKNKKVLFLDSPSDGGHSAARLATKNFLQKFMTDNGVAMTVGNPAQVSDAYLATYDIMIMNFFFSENNYTQFSQASRAAVISWLKKGNKGWVGYHTSGAYDWRGSIDDPNTEWGDLQEYVTYMRYLNHPAGTPQGTVNRTTDAQVLAHPIMQGLPATFNAVDEWYDYDASSKVLTDPSVKVMYTLANAAAINRKPATNHPVAWFREDALKSRFFYATFPHTPDAANSTWFQSMLIRSLEFVSGDPATPVLEAQGASAITHKGLSFVTSSKALQVNLGGKYQLSIFAPNGRKVFAAKGNGAQRFAPDAFAKPGLYLVQVTSRSQNLKQEILIY
jgi:type 1 glutamine amidotransferase